MGLFTPADVKALERIAAALERLVMISELNTSGRGGSSLFTFSQSDGREDSSVSYVNDREEFMKDIERDEVIARGGKVSESP